jgi:hypothetical protein
MILDGIHERRQINEYGLRDLKAEFEKIFTIDNSINDSYNKEKILKTG